MTVKDLIYILLSASNLDAKIYVDNADENDPWQLEEVDRNDYRWGFVIGKVDMKHEEIGE